MATTAAELLIVIRTALEGAQNLDEARARVGAIERSLTQTDQAGRRASSALSALGDAAILAVLAKLTQEIFQAVAGAEAMQNALEQLTGSQELAAQEMEYIARTANRLGVSVSEAVKSYVSLSAATKGTALEGQNTRAIFEAVSGAMATLGKSSADTGLAIRAIAQIASKGTVSMEELRGQLGEALPGAMQAASRAMGVTTEELIKMVSNGEVLATDLLPKLATELNRSFGTEAPDTLNAGLARLLNQVTLTLTKFGETGAIDAFNAAFAALGTTANAVGVVLSGVQESFELVGKIIGTEIGGIVGVLSGLPDIVAREQRKSLDRSAKDIEKFTSVFTEEVEQAGQRTAAAFVPAVSETTRLIKAIEGLQGAGKNASEDLKGLAKILTEELGPQGLTSVEGVLRLSDALDFAGKKAEALQDASGLLIQSLNAADLGAFADSLKSAYEGGQVPLERYLALQQQVVVGYALLAQTAAEAAGKQLQADQQRAESAAKISVIEAQLAGKTAEVRRLEAQATADAISRSRALAQQKQDELTQAQAALAALEASLPVQAERTKEEEKQVRGLEAKVVALQKATAAAQLDTAEAKLAADQQAKNTSGIKDLASAYAKLAELRELLASGAITAQQYAQALTVTNAAIDQLTNASRASVQATQARTAAEQAAAEAADKGALEIRALANAEQDLAKQKELEALATEKAAQEDEEFLGGLRSLSAAIAQYIADVGALALSQAKAAGAADVSTQAFDQFYRSVLSGKNAAQVVGNFSDLFTNIKESAEQARDTAIEQGQTFTALFSKIQSGESTLAELDRSLRIIAASGVAVNDAGRGIVNGLGLIERSRLDGLISQINSAKAAMDSLRRSTEDAIFAQEQRLRQLAGNDLAAKEAEFARAEAELRKQIAAQKDADLRKDLQRQLDLTRKANELELDQLRESIAERKRIEREADAERKARQAERDSERQQTQQDQTPDADQPLPARPTPEPPTPRPQRQTPTADEPDTENRAQRELQAARELAALREQERRKDIEHVKTLRALGQLEIKVGYGDTDLPALTRKITALQRERQALGT